MRVSKPILRVASLLILPSMMLQGCVSFDNREKIAFSTLYNAKGGLDEQAFAGALYRRFSQSDAPIISLSSYVKSLGGSCSAGLRETDKTYCQIPQAGTFCYATNIQLEVFTNGGAISWISAKQKSDGC
jgi:hypothetical protein